MHVWRRSSSTQGFSAIGRRNVIVHYKYSIFAIPHCCVRYLFVLATKYHSGDHIEGDEVDEARDTLGENRYT
jgi:hypothetical protein